MTSFDNLMMMEQPWQFRSTSADAWISDVFTKETEAITEALHNSFASSSFDRDVFSSEMVESFFAKPETTPTVSRGSEYEPPVSKQSRRVGTTGRVTKRKSRATKRSTTTFITADPANFRQMVQQVTGVSFEGVNEQPPVVPVLKPEPLRPFNRLQPVLDTSAFFQDPQQILSISSLMTQPPVLADGSTAAAAAAAAAAGLDFKSVSSFPTLESWKVI